MYEQKIKTALTLQGMRQGELAARIGISANQMSKSLNSQRTFKPPELAKIGAILNIDLGVVIEPLDLVSADEMAARMEFGDRLAAERNRFGNSLEQLSRGICTPERWKDFEAGRSVPSLIELDLMCLKLQDSADYLLRGVERGRQHPSFDDSAKSSLHDADNREDYR